MIKLRKAAVAGCWKRRKSANRSPLKGDGAAPSNVFLKKWGARLPPSRQGFGETGRASHAETFF